MTFNDNSRIKLATSNDGKNWTKLNKNLIDTFLEEDEAQASPDVIFKNGKYHMFFCYRKSKNYRGKENGYRIGYAWSLDLINWNRENSLGLLIGFTSPIVFLPIVLLIMYVENHTTKNSTELLKTI